MLNPIIQKVANLINDDIDPALRRVYEDIVLDLEKVRDALNTPAEPAPAPEGDYPQPELPLDNYDGAPIGQNIPLGLASGTGGTAGIPPVGQPVQEFQPQPVAGEAETLLDAPSEPVAASELAGGQPGSDPVADLVGGLQASHDAAKADGDPIA